MSNLSYKTIFLVIFILVLACILILYVLPYFTQKTEHLTNITSDNLSNIVNHVVYVKYQLDNDIYYLSVVPKKQCSDLKDITANECNSNIPILTKQKDKSCLFDLNTYNNKYTLRSKMVDLISPFLTQNLNYYKGLNLLCFDNDTDDDIINFEAIEVYESDISSPLGVLSGYNLVFKNNNKNYYVGICSPSEGHCNDSKRLCVYEDKSKATAFQFELENGKQIEHFQYLYDNEIDHVSNLDSMYGMNSMYSFGSIDSNKTLISLPGAGNIDNDHLDSFKEHFQYLYDNDNETDHISNLDSAYGINSAYSFGSIDSHKTLISLPGAGNNGNNGNNWNNWNDHLDSFKSWTK